MTTIMMMKVKNNINIQILNSNSPKKIYHRTIYLNKTNPITKINTQSTITT